jgi:ATP-binding cassette subfamily B protein
MPFIMDGLDTEDYDRSYRDRDLLRRILAYFRPHRGGMALTSAMIALSSAAGTAAPILIARTLDVALHSPSLRTLLLLSLGVLLMGVMSWGFNYVRQLYTARIVGDVVLRLREDVFQKVMANDLSFFDEHPAGTILSRVSSDTESFSNVVTLVLDLASQALIVVFLAIYLLTIDATLTLIIVAMAPLAFGVALSFRRVARRVTQNAKRITATINAEIQESISGITVAKSFRQEGVLFSRFLKNNRTAYRVGLERGLTLNTIFPVLGTTSGLSLALLAYTGGLAILRGALTPGDWYLFMQAAFSFWYPLISIASFWSQFQDGLSAAERVFSLMDAEPRVRQLAAEPLSRLRGEVEFRNLSFAYGERERVLDGFSLRIPAGQLLALVGHTGAGKSSIARLIARFYE